MLTILLSILCSTIVLSAPAAENFTAPWVNLRNDKSLRNFQSNLLNESVLPFLKDCYKSPLSDTQTQTLCVNYFDAVLQLNDTNYVVQQSVVEKQLDELKTDEEFCQKAPNFPVAKHYPINTHMNDLHNPQFCGFLCLEMKGVKILPKPICTYLMWMSEALKNQTIPAVAVSTVSKSPAAPNISVGEDVTKHLAEQESITPEKEVQKPTAVVKTDATGRKLEPVHNEPHKKSNVSQAKIESQPANISGNQSSIHQKETSNEGGNVAAASLAQTPLLPNPVEENKQSTSPKENAEEQSPNSNVDRTDDDQTPKQLPTNLGKQESIPIYQPANNEDLNENDSEPDPSEDGNGEDDEDPDDFGIAPQPNSKSKPKETPIAGPDENEPDQKSSQEIFDSNYIPNANHVTDPFLEESGSNFFTYFLFGMFLCIILYVVYHNKSKILALLLEGRRNDKGRGGRRKHTAAYRKLDSNLEEAITSSASGRTTQIIY